MNTSREKATAGQATVTAILCFVVAALEGYDLQVIASAGPLLQKTMQLPPHMMGWLFSASLIGLAIGALAGGWIADRYGRKPTLVVSVLILGIFTFWTAYANSFENLLAVRILAGVGLGGAMPTLIALITEVAGSSKTTSAVTTIICGQPLGGIISALVGHTIAAKYGWQSLFLVGGGLTVLIVPLLMRWLPETRPAGTITLRRMPLLEALFGNGRAPSSLLLWAVFILTLALLSVLLSWTPLLVMGKGLPKSVGLNVIIAINVGGIIGGLVISRLIDRFGVCRPMLALYLTIGVSLYFFAQMQTESMLLLVGAFVGIGTLGAQFSLYGIAPRLYPLAGRGSGVGVAVAMGRIGSILGPVVIGGLISRGSTENEAVLVMVPVGLLAGFVLFLLTLTASRALSATGTARATA